MFFLSVAALLTIRIIALIAGIRAPAEKHDSAVLGESLGTGVRGLVLPAKVAPEIGLEPITRRLTAGCSTIELLWNPEERRIYKSNSLASNSNYPGDLVIPAGRNSTIELNLLNSFGRFHAFDLPLAQHRGLTRTIAPTDSKGKFTRKSLQTHILPNVRSMA